MDLALASRDKKEHEHEFSSPTTSTYSSSKSMINGESEDQMDNNNNKKSCVDCKTTKTPLWRGGPSGPKSLCNACGIRYRKKMVSVMRLSKVNDEKMKRERTQSHVDHFINIDASVCGEAINTSEGLEVKMDFVAFVKKQRCRKKRKLAEEEEAAVLLMALSCGSVFA